MSSIIRFKKKSCRLLVDDQQQVAQKYKHFKGFLEHNRKSLQLISAVESLYYRGEVFSRTEIKDLLDRLKTETAGLIETLAKLSGRPYPELTTLPGSIFAEAHKRMEPKSERLKVPFTVPLHGMASQSAPAVGSKAANLSIIKNSIRLPIPEGFLITTAAETEFLINSGLETTIRDVLDRLDSGDMRVAEKQTDTLLARITASKLPEKIETEILSAYEALERTAGKNVRVAVRSSAVGEDTASSFAGQYHTELNVSRDNLIEAYKKVIASRFSLRAIQYRRRYGFEEADTSMGVACLRMVDAVVSGVSYSVDPVQPESGVMRIAAVAGMGERLVSGEVSPVTFFVEKANGRIVKTEQGHNPEDNELILKVVNDSETSHGT
jgi:pyruvate,water dikinase